jgi:hypothetical protein
MSLGAKLTILFLWSRILSFSEQLKSCNQPHIAYGLAGAAMIMELAVAMRARQPKQHAGTHQHTMS